jgi:hypothetical protein
MSRCCAHHSCRQKALLGRAIHYPRYPLPPAHLPICPSHRARARSPTSHRAEVASACLDIRHSRPPLFPSFLFRHPRHPHAPTHHLSPSLTLLYHTARTLLPLSGPPVVLYNPELLSTIALSSPNRRSLSIVFVLSIKPSYTFSLTHPPTNIMPINLLPASAAAFAPRSAPNVVLNTKAEPWLTATLKRTNKIKRPLNSVMQHTRCLTETLSSPKAIWSLCSIMLPKAPESELRKDSNPLIEALFNYQLVHIEAYVVHVDMVSQNEVAYKLTPETIEALTDYHKEIFSIDTAANTWSWAEKDTQLKKLQEEFVQATNKFVYRTSSTALEGMEEDGAGELLCGRSDEVRTAILGLFVPLLPPPPRIVDVVRPTPLLPSSTGIENWWPSQHMHHMQPAPVEQWKVIPSSPSPVSSCDSHHNMWASVGMHEIQLPSPTPSFSQPYSSAPYSAPQYYSAPAYSTPTTTSSMPSLPLPSMLTQQPCSASMSFGWDRYQEYTMPLPYATAM